MTTYSYTGAVQDHIVGAGVKFVRIRATGAGGGNNSTFTVGLLGGAGSSVEAIYPVTAGETLKVYVGQKGIDGPSGNVAAFGGGGTPYSNGAGGGGASDVRQGGNALTDRIIVGGGGGGAGYSVNNGAPAGWHSGAFASGGAAATQYVGGLGAGTNVKGQDGSFGQGGDANPARAAGTGGGGWYGGGGGGGQSGFGSYTGAGSGGSSYICDAFELALGPGLDWDAPYDRKNLGAVNTGDGEVIITEYTGYDETVGTDTPLASGGTEYDSADGRWHFHKFTSDGTLTVTENGRAEVLAVGGGGQGGLVIEGGGGGGGGVLLMTVYLEGPTMSVVVGAGGTGGASGGDSSIGLAVAKGGGKGGLSTAGLAGGCGGGGSAGAFPGGAGSTQGYNGGGGRGGISAYSEGGGGGGAGTAGQSSPVNSVPGNGGNGIVMSTFDDTTTYYLSGGGAADGGTPGLYARGYGANGFGGGSTGGAAAPAGDPGFILVKYANPYSRVEVAMESEGVMVAGVQQRDPTSIVQVDMVGEGEMAVRLRTRISQQAKIGRPLVWVKNLHGVRKNVID